MLLTSSQQLYKQQLEREGFINIFLQVDFAGKHYAPNRNGLKTAYMVVEGQLTITFFGHPKILDPGDRADVPANCIYEATAGGNGCSYLVAEYPEPVLEGAANAQAE